MMMDEKEKAQKTFLEVAQGFKQMKRERAQEEENFKLKLEEAKLKYEQQKKVEVEEIIENYEVKQKSSHNEGSRLLGEIKMLNEELRNRKEEHTKQLEELRGRIGEEAKKYEAEKEIAITQLKTKMMEELRKAEEEKTSLITNWKQKLEQKEAEFENFNKLGKENDSLTSRLREMSSQLKQGEEYSKQRVEVLEQKIKEIDEENSELSSQLIQLQDATRENHQLKIDMVDLRLEKGRVADINTKLEMQVQNLQNKSDQLSEKLNNAYTKLKNYDELKARNEFLENELIQKSAKLLQIHKTLDVLQNSINKDQHSVSDHTERLRQERDQIDKELSVVQTTLQNLESEVIPLKDEQISRSSSQIKELQNNMNSLQAQLEDKTEQYNLLKTAAEKLGEETTKAKEIIEELKNQKEELRDQLLTNQAEINSLKDKEESIQKELSQASSQIPALKQETELYKKENTLRGTELSSLKESLQDAIEQTKSLKSKINILETEKDRFERESQSLKKDLMVKDSTISYLEQNMNELKQGNTSELEKQLEGARKELKVKSDTLSQSLESSLSEVNSLRKKIEEQNSSIDELTTELRLREARINRSEIELADRNSRIKYLEEELAKVLYSIEQYQDTSKNAEIQTSELRKQVIEMSEELAVKNSSLEEYETSLKEFQEELNQIRHDKTNTALVNSNIAEDLGKARDKIEELEASLKKVTTEYSDCRGQLSTLKLKVLNLESKTSMNTLNYEDMLKDKIEILNEKDEEIIALQTECDSLAKKLEEIDDESVVNSTQFQKLLKENLELATSLNEVRITEVELRKEISSREEEVELLSERVHRLETKLRQQNNSGNMVYSPSRNSGAETLEERLYGRIKELENLCMNLEGELKTKTEPSNNIRSSQVYKQEAEKFRLMYNDAQRELIKLNEEREVGSILKTVARPPSDRATPLSQRRNHTKNEPKSVQMNLHVELSDDDAPEGRTIITNNFTP